MAEISDWHKTLLYRIALRQDEQGRQSSLIRLRELEKHAVFQDLLDLEFLTYQLIGEGDKAIARMIVTLKGERYCRDNIEELSKLDAQL